MTKIAIVIQARASSRRFPGKVLAPVLGTPMIEHVVRRCQDAADGSATVAVATSTERADDPIAAYVNELSVPCIRGSHLDVLARFRTAARELDTTWIGRVSADSPFISPSVIRLVCDAIEDDLDVITNVHPRTFPRGQSVELIHRGILERVGAASDVSRSDREHVTPWFYRHEDSVRIRNLACPFGNQSHLSHVVDRLEDLMRLENAFATGRDWFEEAEKAQG